MIDDRSCSHPHDDRGLASLSGITGLLHHAREFGHVARRKHFRQLRRGKHLPLQPQWKAFEVRDFRTLHLPDVVYYLP